jgi:poly-D-alanine transfer protein DltD
LVTKNRLKSLKGLLVSLRDKVIYTLKDIEADIEVINTQAHSERYEDHEIDLLIRNYLSGIKKTKRQILYDKPRIKEQKKLIEKQDNFVSDANMSEGTITLPTELKILPQDLEEITQEQQTRR